MAGPAGAATGPAGAMAEMTGVSGLGSAGCPEPPGNLVKP